MANTHPDITFRDVVSPYTALSSGSYVQSSIGGNNLPVLQGENSNLFLFRIYNNFAKNANIASAINITVGLFDGANASSHTATKSPVSQSWVRIYETGWGENSSTPGLYTQYTGEDVAMGALFTAGKFYTPEFGSAGTSTAQIRAGTTASGVGFLEFATYAELPDSVGMFTYTFAISIQYEWIP